MPTSKEDVQALSARADAATARLAEVRQSIARSIIGLDDVVEQSLAVILSGGHALLVGAPGLAKTRLVHALARCSQGLTTSGCSSRPT
jgi:MoxR-like ATPase